jgi:Ca2+-binding RTX toxin-like protein
VTVDLTLTAAQNTVGGGTDTLVTIENLIGSNFNDLLTGTATVNKLEGGTGADTLVGGAGADLLYGGDGDDRFVVALAADLATGEIINGSNGTDELRFTSTVASTLTLTAGVAVENIVVGTGTASSAVTTATTAINVNAALAANGMSMLGNAGANTLTGSAFNDSIDGGAGNDSLIGGAGSDRLTGGLGNDTLTGGLGADVFIFNSAPNASSNKDTITDFKSADDDIWLAKAVMGGLTNGVLSANDFRGGAGFTTSGDSSDRVIYNQTTGALYYDADGTGATAAVQFAQVTAGTVLSASDFFIF